MVTYLKWGLWDSLNKKSSGAKSFWFVFGYQNWLKPKGCRLSRILNLGVSILSLFNILSNFSCAQESLYCIFIFIAFKFGLTSDASLSPNDKSEGTVEGEDETTEFIYKHKTNPSYNFLRKVHLSLLHVTNQRLQKFAFYGFCLLFLF